MNALSKIALLLALLPVCACSTLHADYLVVTGPDPDARIEMAADELAHYLHEMTGAEVVRTVSRGRVPRAGQGTFLIGNPENNPAIARVADRFADKTLLDTSDLKNDGIIIHSVGEPNRPVVVMGGQSAISNLYAVYEYLEEYCDAGFFYDGDYIPHHDSVPMQDLALRHEPFFRDRHFGFSMGFGPKKYFNRFKTFTELDQMTDWMAKRKLNLTGWHMGTSPDYNGTVALDVFDFECKPEENYGAGWPGGTWGYPPEYRTQYIQHFFKSARRRDVRIYYSLSLGEVPRQYRMKHPDLPYVPSLGYDATFLMPDSPEASEISGRMIDAINRLYGTDHIYQCTPFVESPGAATPEESFNLKLEASRQLCNTLARLDPQYIWQSDSWDFGSIPAVWTPERVDAYFDGLAAYRDHMYMYDTTSDSHAWWQRSNYFGGVDWAFGVLHSFQGDDHLHGNLQDLIRRVQQAVTDPRSTRLMGYFNIPESFGHNILYFNLSTKLAWDPLGIELEEFLQRYCVTRYGAEHAEAMLEPTRKLVDAVYTGGGSDMLYQRMGIRYNPFISPPFDDLPGALQNDREVKREVLLMEQVVQQMLAQSEAQKDNPLFINDLVDYTRTMLGLKSNVYLVDAWNGLKTGDRQRFESAAARTLECLNGIEQILSTRPDFSLQVMVDDVMSVRGSNPYLPRMIRKHCINDMYASVENYEQLALYYKPKMEAYFEVMRRKLERGETAFRRDDLNEAFDALDRRWLDNEAICPPEWRFDGSTLEAVRANWQIVPLGEIKLAGPAGIDLKVNQVIEAAPNDASGGPLRPVQWEDGRIVTEAVDGRQAWRIESVQGRQYLYFQVDRSVAYECSQPVALTVHYFDGPPAQLELHYDSNAGSASLAGAYSVSVDGAYKSIDLVRTSGSNEWKTVRVVLEDPRFAKRQNGGADFRFCVVGGSVAIGGVALASPHTTELPTIDVIQGKN